MSLIVDNIFWILVVSGALTSTMIFFALAPRAGFQSAFGETLPESPSFAILARTFGTIVTAYGVLLILAAFHPEIRIWVLPFVAAGKLTFALSVFIQGGRYRNQQAFVGAVLDLVMVVLFVSYLAAS